MPFQKGKKKTGGRQKGSVNKDTIEKRDRAERLLQIIETDYLENDIKSLTSLQRSNLYLGLMEYTLPKLRRVDGNLNANISFLEEETVFD